MVWRHVGRDKRFIIAEAETVMDANWYIREFFKKSRFIEVIFPCFPAEWGNNWEQLIAKDGIG
jgi:hypothetical protein